MITSNTINSSPRGDLKLIKESLEVKNIPLEPQIQEAGIVEWLETMRLNPVTNLQCYMSVSDR